METTTLQQFQKSVKASMLNIKTLDEMRKEDKMVDEVYRVSREIFDKDLDTMALPFLISNGGRLASIRAYLGNKYARARAERDFLEQKKDEVLNRLTAEYYGESENKITLARSRAKQETADIEELIVISEFEKKSMEELLNSLDRLIGFIQSAIKVKQSDNFVGRTLSDNYN